MGGAWEVISWGSNAVEVSRCGRMTFSSSVVAGFGP